MKQAGVSTDADVYRNAAKLVEDGVTPFSCNAINYAVGDFSYTHPAVVSYKAAMAPEGFSAVRVADFEGSYPDNVPPPDAENHRILALCFMAAMVEAGDA